MYFLTVHMFTTHMGHVWETHWNWVTCAWRCKCSLSYLSCRQIIHISRKMAHFPLIMRAAKSNKRSQSVANVASETYIAHEESFRTNQNKAPNALDRCHRLKISRWLPIYITCHQNTRRELWIIDGAGAGRFLTALLPLSIINGVSIKKHFHPSSIKSLVKVEGPHSNIPLNQRAQDMLCLSLISPQQIRIITAQIAKLFTAWV